MATLWSNTAAKDIFVLLEGNVQSGPVVGVKSCTTIEVTSWHDGDNYRDLISFPNTPSVAEGSPQPQVANVENLGPGFPPEPPFDYLVKCTEAGVTTSASIPDAYSASDEFTHIPPRTADKNTTIIAFWDDVNGTGDCVFSCPFAIFKSHSTAQDAFIT